LCLNIVFLVLTQKVKGSITVALALNMVELAEPDPATITFLTDLHISLYSAATGPGGSSSKKSLSQTISRDSCACTLLRILDMFMVLGMNTFLWLDALARNEANPRGVSISKLMNTGLHVYPEFTS